MGEETRFGSVYLFEEKLCVTLSGHDHEKLAN